MTTNDSITDAIQQDLQRRDYERWVKEFEKSAFVPQPVSAPQHSPQFWRTLEGIYDDIGQALDAIPALGEDPHAPTLVAHLQAARECLLPLMRELAAQPTPEPWPEPFAPTVAANQRLMAQAAQAVLTHNKLAQALGIVAKIDPDPELRAAIARNYAKSQLLQGLSPSDCAHAQLAQTRGFGVLPT
jgi:hypothetical protein